MGNLKVKDTKQVKEGDSIIWKSESSEFFTKNEEYKVVNVEYNELRRAEDIRVIDDNDEQHFIDVRL